MARPAVFLGLGSNMGDRLHHLRQALALLPTRGFEVRRQSALYLTDPVGGPPQERYLNMVVLGESRLAPAELLSACLEIERMEGRVRAERWGPRSLDIDLLLYGDEQRTSETLTLPHPRLHERLFVLVPLAEIAPDLRHPRLGLTASELRERCADRSRVLRYDPRAGAAA